MTHQISRARLVIAILAILCAVALGAILLFAIASPGLGDGVHQIGPASLLLLLPSASFGIVALLALILPERDRVVVAGAVSVLFLLPVVFVSLAIHPSFGLIVARVLVVPLVVFWVVLYRWARPRNVHEHEIA